MTTLYQDILAVCTPEEIAAKNYHVIAAKVGSKSTTVTKLITERGIRAALGPVVGSKFMSLLKSLETAATAQAIPSWLTAVLTGMGAPSGDHIFYLDTLGCAYAWVRQDPGLDIGDATTRSMLDLIAAGNSDVAAGCVALKALASQSTKVTWEQCQAALEQGA